jgi:hypothetical protein
MSMHGIASALLGTALIGAAALALAEDRPSDVVDPWRSDALGPIGYSVEVHEQWASHAPAGPARPVALGLVDPWSKSGVLSPAPPSVSAPPSVIDQEGGAQVASPSFTHNDIVEPWTSDRPPARGDPGREPASVQGAMFQDVVNPWQPR